MIGAYFRWTNHDFSILPVVPRTVPLARQLEGEKLYHRASSQAGQGEADLGGEKWLRRRRHVSLWKLFVLCYASTFTCGEALQVNR